MPTDGTLHSAKGKDALNAHILCISGSAQHVLSVHGTQCDFQDVQQYEEGQISCCRTNASSSMLIRKGIAWMATQAPLLLPQEFAGMWCAP
jgi:hypothetical protein